MEKFSFVVWVIGYPLVDSLTTYLYWLTIEDKSRFEWNKGAKMLSFLVWLLMGILLWFTS